MAQQQKRSSLGLLDTWLLVALALLAGFVALRVLSWVVGTVLFVVKLGVLALLIALVLHFALRNKRD